MTVYSLHNPTSKTNVALFEKLITIRYIYFNQHDIKLFPMFSACNIIDEALDLIIFE